MKLSVVILNYNVQYFLELCLKSVQAAISTIDAEIIVVDNNSPDESCKMAKQLFPEVILIENKENLGFSKGNNKGIRVANGEYICILNPDTVVAEDTFTSLLKFVERTEKLGIVGCKLIDGEGQFLPESKRNIPLVKVAIQKIFGNSKKYYANHLNENETGKVDVLVGAFMLMKRNVYDEINGFDEDYFMYGEDIDLSYRILKAGYNNYYFSDTTIIHYKGESTLKDKTYSRHFYQAMQIFYDKHYKSNTVFDILVWLGIRFGALFQNSENQISLKPKQYVLISEEKNESLQRELNQELKLQSQIKEYSNHLGFILDNSFLSFKSIIEIISKKPKNSVATFKILPKNSNFIIGSNSSKNQGEVICIELN